MIRHSIAAVIFLMATFSAFAQSNVARFEYALNPCGAVFKMPRGFYEIPLPANDSVSQFAIKDSTRKFEARYSIIPYSIAFPNDEHSLDTLTFARFDSAIRLYAKGIPNGLKYITPYLTDGSLKKESGADRGWYSIFYPKPEFGGDYLYCLAVVMRKEGVGEFYIFELFTENDREMLVIIEDVRMSLKFKQ
jgi:hypothetical protein